MKQNQISALEAAMVNHVSAAFQNELEKLKV